MNLRVHESELIISNGLSIVHVTTVEKKESEIVLFLTFLALDA